MVYYLNVTNASFFSPPVLMPGGLLCIVFCLSAWPPQNTALGCKRRNMVSGGVRTDSWGAKVTCDPEQSMRKCLVRLTRISCNKYEGQTKAGGLTTNVKLLHFHS